MTRLGLLVTMAVLGLGVAACGDGGESQQDTGESGSEPSYAADANRVCAEGQRPVADQYLERGVPRTPQDQLDLDVVLLGAREDLAAGLRRIDPPADRKQAYARFVSLREAVTSLSRDLVKADRRGDTKTGDAINSKIEELLARSPKAASKAGLDVCARKLSADDAKAVRAMITEFEKSADPERVCRDLVTTYFLNSRFPGGYSQCAAEVKKNADTYAKSVDFSRLEGTDGVEATVEFRDVGGKYGGELDSARLYYEDGQWKLFSAEVLEPNS